MQLKDILEHFKIEIELPDYLFEESFNRVFLDGSLEKTNDSYKISIKTRQNVTHNMIIAPNDASPLTIISELPNGHLNGMKFGQNKGDVQYINQFP